MKMLFATFFGRFQFYPKFNNGPKVEKVNLSGFTVLTTFNASYNDFVGPISDGRSARIAIYAKRRESKPSGSRAPNRLSMNLYRINTINARQGTGIQFYANQARINLRLDLCFVLLSLNFLRLDDSRPLEIQLEHIPML